MSKRGLGANPRCRKCGYRDPDALQRDAEGVICYECARVEAGKSTVEDDHAFGRDASSLTVPLSANIHRAKSARAQDWPEELRHVTPSEPFLWIARFIRSLADWCLTIGSVAGGVADWLLEQHRRYVKGYGDNYAATMGWPRLGDLLGE